MLRELKLFYVLVRLCTKLFGNFFGINFDGFGNFTPALAFIVGYAGGDLLENIYKIVLKKPSLYEIAN